MATLYKEGVCGRLARQMRRCKGRLAAIHRAKGADFIITSLCDGNHSDTSLHPQGDALDCRYHENVSRQDIKNCCPEEDFDVVFESNHIHIEYDPK